VKENRKRKQFENRQEEGKKKRPVSGAFSLPGVFRCGGQDEPSDIYGKSG